MEKTEKSCSYIKYIDVVECIGCAACTVVCGTGAIEYNGEVAVVAHPELCDGDGLCREACPTDAIH